MDLHKLFASGWHTRQQKKLYAQLSAVLAAGDDFVARKVFESDDEGEVLQKEIETIQQHGIDNLFNGVSSKLFGAITSQKAAQVRQAISRARKGMKFSAEHREKLRQANLRRPPPTPEQRQRQSAAQTGKAHPRTFPEMSLDQRIAQRVPALTPEERKQREIEKHRRYRERQKQKAKGVVEALLTY